MRTSYATSPAFTVLPRAPSNGSRVPWLTSLHTSLYRGDYGDARYRGNCDGYLIRDLLLYFRPKTVLDPMTGSGTCRDVCDELDIPCRSNDLRLGRDACDPKNYLGIGTFDFVWLHPPYWRCIPYSNDPRDLSAQPTLEDFLARYQQLLENCAGVLNPGGHLAILMGDYSDREVGFVPLCYHTQRLCFEAGLKQTCTQIVRLQHNNSSSLKTYRSSFIPGLHDLCTVVEKVQ
jgi:hypothetical protein